MKKKLDKRESKWYNMQAVARKATCKGGTKRGEVIEN